MGLSGKPPDNLFSWRVLISMKSGSIFLPLTCFLLAAGSIAHAQEDEAVRRSSHPRGIAGNGFVPGFVANVSSPLTSTGVAPSSPGGYQQQAHPGAPSAVKQTTREGINIKGTTRIDARAGETTATAAGTKNAAGNRVGAIGGRSD